MVWMCNENVGLVPHEGGQIPNPIKERKNISGRFPWTREKVVSETNLSELLETNIAMEYESCI